MVEFRWNSGSVSGNSAHWCRTDAAPGWSVVDMPLWPALLCGSLDENKCKLQLPISCGGHFIG